MLKIDICYSFKLIKNKHTHLWHIGSLYPLFSTEHKTSAPRHFSRKSKHASLFSKKVIYNYLNFISVENICSGINIKGTVTSSIWTIKGGIFIWSVVWRNIFMELICLLGGVCENLISKKNTNPPLLDRLKMDFRQPF